MGITYIGWIALGVMAILIPLQIYIGYRVAGKSSSSAKHYFVSGKELPLLLVFFADFATAFGVGNFIGYAGKGYQIGLNAFWMMLGEQGSKIFFAFLLAGVIGRYAYTTMNEFMEQEMFHDKWLRAIGGIVMTIPLICGVGAQAIGIGTILHMVMGVDVLTGIWVASLTAVLYTMLGGMWAIVWTDLLQGVIRIVVGCVFYAVVFVGVGWLGGIKTSVVAVQPSLWEFSSIGILPCISLMLAPLVGQFTHQSWWQRCFAAKDYKTARNGFLLTGIFCIVMVSFSILMGLAAHGLNPNLAKPDMAFAWMMTNYLHPILAGLLVVTIIGADMTLSAGYLNSGVTLLVMDVIKPLLAKKETTDKDLIRWARYLTLVLGVGTIWAALSFPSVLDAAWFGYAVAGGGLFMPMAVGLAWKKAGKTCVTKNAAITSLVLGGGTVVVFQLIPSLCKIFGGGIIPGVLVSFIVTVGVSLVERSMKTQATAAG